MTSSEDHPVNQPPLPDFPREIYSERPFSKQEAFTALRLLHEREQDIEVGFSTVVKREELLDKGEDMEDGEALYVDILNRSLDTIGEKLRQKDGYIRYNFAKAIGIAGEMSDEVIEKYPGYQSRDIARAKQEQRPPSKPRLKKVFRPHDQTRETELNLRLEYFVERYGGSEPEIVRRRQRVLAHEEEIKIPSYKAVLAIKALREKKQNEPGPEQDVLFDTERLFSGEGHSVRLNSPEDFDELARAAQQVLDGVDLLMMRNSSRSYYEYITDPARANIEHVEIESKPKSDRPSMVELERMAKENIAAALSNETALKSGLFPQVVVDAKDIEIAYTIWEEIYAAAGNEEKDGLREAARKITEEYKKEKARRQISDK